MLYLVGLGLGDEKDITVKGLEIVRACDRVYLEAYTSILGVDKERLEAFYGREIILADREMVESNSDAIMENAEESDVALLVVGDPFGATTHTDMFVRAAKEKGISCKCIHNASIMNAVAACGLQLYNFGQTVSIPFWELTWKPDSFYEKIAQNAGIGLHTLCLLDIKVKEQSLENLMKGVLTYEPPRYMTVQQALEQLLEIEANKREGVCTLQSRCVGLARVGLDDQKIVAGTVEEMLSVDFGGPLHCLVLVGKTHFMEDEVLEFYKHN